jgi:hypothetical protein
LIYYSETLEFTKSKSNRIESKRTEINRIEFFEMNFLNRLCGGSEQVVNSLCGGSGTEAGGGGGAIAGSGGGPISAGAGSRGGSNGSGVGGGSIGDDVDLKCDANGCYKKFV